MPRTVEQLTHRVEALTQAGARGRLLARGLARGFIWRDGQLPPDSPAFGSNLTADLLDYAFALLLTAIELKEGAHETDATRAAFRTAAEALEAAVRRGGPNDPERGFHLVVAACAFHLGSFAARAYCLLPTDPSALNLSSTERTLTFLLRRSLKTLRSFCIEWLHASEHSDDGVAEQLSSKEGSFSVEDAIAVAFARNFHRALALFDSALHHGQEEAYREARALLIEGAEAATDARFVPVWWTHTLARHLIDDLWRHSLHQTIPASPVENGEGDHWNSLRRSYISLLEARDVAEIDLWPSQLEAARRCMDQQDDLVVALPTSAGKTRIAELTILRTLGLGRRVVYVTPLRALSSQVERVLGRIFRPLGFSVSSLYGASGVAVADVGTLKSAQIVVATPEKLDFAIRQDPSVLDDVGLVVLDEGHMIGLGTREVRYEVLVNRLLRRADAGTRRIVCLSAIFGEGQPFADFCSWLRADEPGLPIRSEWRPTRQRRGVLRWHGTYARLNVNVEGEQPYITRFVTAREAIKPRRKSFPQSKNELVIAAAQRFIEDGTKVLIYCPTRTSVESLAELCLKLHRQKYLEPLLSDSAQISKAVQVGTEWLGANHVAVRALQLGIAVHHGFLPRQFLHEVERLLNAKVLPLAISSPTLAQGVDISCSTLIFHSIYRNRDVIPPSEFANVVGRAGRAFVDLDGLTVIPVFEPSEKLRKDYQRLIVASTSRQLESGLVLLIREIARRLSEKTGASADKLLEYVLNQDYAWAISQDVVTPEDEEDDEAISFDGLIADLDAAILALVDNLDLSTEQLADSLDTILAGSLWTRRLAHLSDGEKKLQHAVLLGRAQWLWCHSDSAQRKGYFAAGIGHAAGQFLDTNLDSLVAQVLEADAAVHQGNIETAIPTVLVVAETLMSVHPFVYAQRPEHWRDLVSGWVRGVPLNELLKTGSAEEIGFIQQGVVYHLVWAVEAVRVHALARGYESANSITGDLALALTYGMPSRSGALLIEAGVSSRSIAKELPARFGGTYTDTTQMKEWLRDVIPQVRQSSLWGEDSDAKRLWAEFVDDWTGAHSSAWAYSTHELRVTWHTSAPPNNERPLRLSVNGHTVHICAEDLTILGEIVGGQSDLFNGNVTATVGSPGTVLVHRFGPPLSEGNLA